MEMGFEPLIVRAHLVTPLSVVDPIPMEGILYDVRFRRDPTLVGQPLDCLAYDRGIPKASVGFILKEGLYGVANSSVSVVKRVDTRGSDVHKMALEGMPSTERSISADSIYRPRLREYALLEGVREVSFQVLGDPRKIEGMLSQVPNIGTLRQRGYGQVAEWEVCDCTADPVECGWFADGRLLRRLPVEMVTERMKEVPEGVRRSYARLEPPFFAAGEEVDVMDPTLRSVTGDGDFVDSTLSKT